MLKTEEFIKKAKKIHGDKYNYSKVIYINNKVKVKIFCSIHGEFEQTPCKHLSGQGCRKCGIIYRANSQRLSREDFINKSQKIHKNKYNYSKVEYVNSKTKVKIFCPLDGEFYQTPDAHLRGQGCPLCYDKVYDLEQFVKKANEVHNYKYNYSDSRYIGSFKKIKIICPEHGEFKQIARTHLNGAGCAKCAKNFHLNTSEFVKKVKEIHIDRYNYSKVKYVNSKTKIIIICPKHGEFLQRPAEHLLKKRGCPRCSYNNNKSILSQKWLDLLKIPSNWREKTVKIKSKWFKVDALDEKNKTIYEFDGDFWHGNPKIYNPNDVNPINKTTYGELYNKTLQKKSLLEKAGYKVISIWESDFK